jgi:hypothetical protein
VDQDLGWGVLIFAVIVVFAAPYALLVMTPETVNPIEVSAYFARLTRAMNEVCHVLPPSFDREIS